MASFFTGITEPLEFSFMFLAPVLFLLHAVLTGLSLYIAASMEWMAGFGFSAGFVDLVLSSQNPLAVNWYMLLVQGVVTVGKGGLQVIIGLGKVDKVAEQMKKALA